jgi:hypothetical protein
MDRIGNGSACSLNHRSSCIAFTNIGFIIEWNRSQSVFFSSRRPCDEIGILDRSSASGRGGFKLGVGGIFPIRPGGRVVRSGIDFKPVGLFLGRHFGNCVGRNQPVLAGSSSELDDDAHASLGKFRVCWGVHWMPYFRSLRAWHRLLSRSIEPRRRACGDQCFSPCSDLPISSLAVVFCQLRVRPTWHLNREARWRGLRRRPRLPRIRRRRASPRRLEH